MRYYDSASDTLIKGLIDLSDVESVTQGLLSSSGSGGSNGMQVGATAGTPTSQYAASTKKALNTLISGANSSLMAATAASEAPDPKCYFELRTSKRVYCFCAKSQLESSKWVKQLQICCLDS